MFTSRTRWLALAGFLVPSRHHTPPHCRRRGMRLRYPTFGTSSSGGSEGSGGRNPGSGSDAGISGCGGTGISGPGDGAGISGCGVSGTGMSDMAAQSLLSAWRRNIRHIIRQRPLMVSRTSIFWNRIKLWGLRQRTPHIRLLRSRIFWF